jgi:hypothetical protein
VPPCEKDKKSGNSDPTGRYCTKSVLVPQAVSLQKAHFAPFAGSCGNNLSEFMGPPERR